MDSFACFDFPRQVEVLLSYVTRLYCIVLLTHGFMSTCLHVVFVVFVVFVVYTVTPYTKCRLKMLKLERIKDYLLLEEEFIKNQERLKPQEEKQEVLIRLIKQASIGFVLIPLASGFRLVLLKVK